MPGRPSRACCRYHDITSVLQQVLRRPRLATSVRQVGMSEQTFYRWRKSYGSILRSEGRESRQRREQNARLKRAVADLILDKVMLQDVVQQEF